jgi:hypothetical protein
MPTDLTSNCIICGNAFEYRKGKQYCSESCKTKAYNLRKEGVAATGSKMRPRGSGVVFKLDEYEKWIEIGNDFSLTPDVFFFLRKNLPDNLSIERIDKLIKEYYEKTYITEHGSINIEKEILFASFNEFQRLFFDGYFTIKTSEKNETN